MKSLTARQMAKILIARGWYMLRQTGSHAFFVNSNDMSQRTVIPMHKGKTLPIGTQREIMRDADLTQDDLI